MEKLKYLSGLLIVIATIVAVFWLANRFGSGEKVESEKAAIVCKKENECFWTAHIHATIKVFQDNNEILLTFEQGKLEGIHTHTEKNNLHWHGLIRVDQTREVKDWSAFTIERLLKDLDLSIEDGPRIIVNNKEVGLAHTWQDGDTIEIRYVK